jgi:UPF0042 nucleotide-binding protein
LRETIHRTFGGQKGSPDILVQVNSFGYRHGVPADSDLVFDVRFLPNPNFVTHLKHLNGGDPEVIEYMNAQDDTGAFLNHFRGFLDYLMPQYEREGKAYVTIAIGCTGGRHRSVFITNAIADHFAKTGSHVKVTHRDVEKS